MKHIMCEMNTKIQNYLENSLL